jgi:hypothetical protein
MMFFGECDNAVARANETADFRLRNSNSGCTVWSGCD